jgi:Tc5 transposase DNA-binding domain
MENPDYWTSEKLAEHFKIQDASSVRKWLKESKKCLNLSLTRAEEGKTKDRKAKYPTVNEAFAMFVQNAEANGIPLTDSVLSAWALNFVADLIKKGDEYSSYENFKASPGWIGDQKKRFGMRGIVTHGEASSVKEELLIEERHRLQSLLTEYELNDIYNAVRLGCFIK